MKKYLIVLGIAVLAVSPCAFSQEVGDVYMWEFNEGNGITVTDNSGAFTANMGIPVADDQLPGSVNDSPSGNAGDRSIDPNGGLTVDDSDGPIMAIQDGPITIEAWVKPEDLSGWVDICRYGNAYKMGFSGGTLLWTFLGIEDVFSASLLEPDGNWHHIAMAWEPGVGVEFFLDGEVADYVETTNGNRALQNNNLAIGSAHDGSSNLQSLIDRLRIHNAVLDISDLDSDAANPKAPLASTVAAYNFDEADAPWEASVPNRAADSLAIDIALSTAPEFSTDNPQGGTNDYSLYFDGTDRVIFTDEEDIMQFIDEDFTFETWIKFDAEDQVSDRPVLFAYGIGGQNGYSFSFRPGGIGPAGSADSPSGSAGDRSVDANSGLAVDDTDSPVLEIQEGPITIEAWVKPEEDIVDWIDICRYGNAYKMGFRDGTLLWTFLGVEDVFSDYTMEIDGQWHHVAMAWEPGAGVAYYFDGEEVAYTETANGNRDLENNQLTIGTSHTGTSEFQGLIDRFRIHNAVLAASELDSDAASPKAPLADTIVAYNFDEDALPYQNTTSADRPAVARAGGSMLTVTTFGIIDAHSNAQIPDDGGWHHIAAVHQQDLEFRYYVDGQLGETMPYTGGVRFAEVWDFIIGSESNGGHPFVGNLDRVKITRDALTESGLDYFAPTSIEEWSLF